MKKVSKAAKRRLTIFGTVSLLAILYFSINLFSYTIKIINLRSEETELKDKLTSLKNKEEELSTEIVKLHDPEYIARYARENYQYSKNGEYIIQINDDEDKNEDIKEKHDYTIIFLSVIIAISTTLIVKKISRI